MSLLSDARATVIAAAGLCAKLAGEALIALGRSADERLNAFSESEAGDYLHATAAPHDPLFCPNPWPCEVCGAPFKTPSATPHAEDDPEAVRDDDPSPLAPSASGSPTCRVTDVCKHCAGPVELFIEDTPNGRAGVWMHARGTRGHACPPCPQTYAAPK